MATVYLVGAGPGDPELLTLKALRLIQQADVLLFDDLVSHDVLALVPASVKKIGVGKRGGCKSTPQMLIQRLMLRYVRQGKNVVRLKGGDPTVFGRAGEEKQFLESYGVSVEVVPGITSALAAANACGFALTHRDYTQGVAFVTGHQHPNSQSPIDWQALVDSGLTLVIYMGIRNHQTIQQSLLSAGMPVDMPIALVQSASTAVEKRLITNLQHLHDDIERHDIHSPTVMIVGRVVNLGTTENSNNKTL
jgi:uroporphyrin-III C-methyltransferase